MTKWEYEAIYLTHSIDEDIKSMNELGKYGWEAFTTVESIPAKMYFKKEIDE
ncbi:MAG: hypothetical protein KAS32_04455 [Candidatus Peribacteraceae bacterium]|nr:hypothetical protein [Candidatus Peribacteraceae bacterium]